MQLMPQTARQMGVQDPHDPEEQIRAGTEYLEWLYRRFPSEIEHGERLAFALAAYNAGWGHVRDARRVAELTGLDPNRWFDSVERSMLSLSDPDVYRYTRHGYVRGKEPVYYVRRINELGQMYSRLIPAN
jgi:membrane-bound lytic murein transglycosylase F